MKSDGLRQFRDEIKRLEMLAYVYISQGKTKQADKALRDVKTYRKHIVKTQSGH